MSAQRMLHYCTSLAGRRYIHQSAKKLESKASDGINKASTTNPSHGVSQKSDSIMGPRTMIPSDFEKWVLVWVKKYPKGEVPEKITEEVMYQAKTRGRIKACNYMLVASIIGCILAAISGKQAAKSGDTIQNRNMAWHKKIKEEHEAQLKNSKS